jgi:hypothetical protein
MATIRGLGVAGLLTDGSHDGLTDSATTMYSLGLAALPVVASPDIAKVVAYQHDEANTLTQIEVIYVTAHADGATSATVERGMEGTTGQVWSATDFWSNSDTILEWLIATRKDFVLEDFGCKGDRTQLIVSFAADETEASFCSPPLTDADVGKSIRIMGAGESPAALVTTVVSVADGLPTIGVSSAFLVTNVAATIGTDDTEAFQNCINAAAAADGTVRALSLTGYVCAGELQDSSTYNAVLEIPQNATTGPDDSTPAAVIAFRGPGAAPNGGYLNGAALPATGCVVEFFAVGSGTDPCGLGAGAAADEYGDATFNFIHVAIRGMTFRTCPDQGLIALNLGPANTCSIEGVTADKSNPSSLYDVPTSTDDMGIRFPNNNNGASVYVRDVWIDGYYYGYTWPEHLDSSNVNAMHCVYGAQVQGAFHSSHAGRVGFYWCINNLTFITSVHTLVIDVMDIEHGSGDWVNTADIVDASDYGHGEIGWHVVLADVGIDDTFTVTGGTNLRTVRIYDGGEPPPEETPPGALTWTDCTMENGWTDHSGDGFQVPQYAIDSNDIVHIRGVANGAAATGTVMFQLPSGFRPATSNLFGVVVTDSGATSWLGAGCSITTGGNVSIQSITGGNITPDYAPLGGITFSIDS